MLKGSEPVHVWVVDDDDAVRSALMTRLRSEGWDVLAFASGGAFFAAYEDRGPGCILCDIRMPDMSGLQLLERLKLARISHPVIMMTGYSEVETAVSSFRQGVLDYIEKPFDNGRLISSVRHAIDYDRNQRDLHRRCRELRSRIARLSDRERQIMYLLIEGRPNKEIAYQLDLSEKTIAAHKAHILRKMELESLPQLVSRIVAMQWIEGNVQTVAA